MTAIEVSVILPTRNRLRKLRRALRSVNGQTFRQFDVWIIDDGSTDGTGDYLASERLKQDCPDIPSINVLSNAESLGAAAARNTAIRHSGGKMIAFLDDDDVWLPGYLDAQVKRLSDNPGTACCARHVEFDGRGGGRFVDTTPLLGYDQPLVHLLAESYIHTMSVFVCRRSSYDSVGPLQESLNIVHDWDWYARFLRSGYSIRPPEGEILVRREIPGGLVAKYKEWRNEELYVLDAYLNEPSGLQEWRNQAGAHRALLFARVGLENGDFGFATQRLVEAFRLAPLHSMRIIARKLVRHIRLPMSRTGSRQQEIAFDDE